MLYTAKGMFSRVCCNQPVCLSVCLSTCLSSVYSIAAIVLKFCRYVHHVLKLCKKVFNHLVSMVRGLSLFEIRKSLLTLSAIGIDFNTMKKKSFWKTLWKKVKLLKMSNFTFFHNFFYAICILKSFSSNISVVFCSFLEFGMVSKCCIREWSK